MSAPLKLKFGVVAAGLSCLVVGYACAQQVIDQQLDRAGQAREAAQQPGQIDRTATPQGQPYTAQFRGTQGAGGQNQEVEKHLASCWLSKNQAEIEFAQMAQQQSQNPQVKEFAQMLVKDHTQLVQKLQPLAGTPSSAGRTNYSNTQGAAGQTDAQRQIGQAGGQNAALNELASIEKAIGERCKENLREELQQKQGAEFDKCYVGSQIGGHMQSVAALEVLEQQGPGQLKQIAQEARPTVQQHLDHAKQLMKQLEGSGSTSTDQAERQSPQRQR